MANSTFITDSSSEHFATNTKMIDAAAASVESSSVLKQTTYLYEDGVEITQQITKGEIREFLILELK